MRAKSWSWWARSFLPVENLDPVGGRSDVNPQDMFETFGSDLNAVLDVANTDEHHVWTLVDCYGARGRRFGAIVPGYHLVNRLGYYVTVFPWSDPQMEVVA